MKSKVIFSFAGFNCQIICSEELLIILKKYYPKYINKSSRKNADYSVEITGESSKSSSNRLTTSIDKNRRIVRLKTNFDLYAAFPMIDRAIKKAFMQLFAEDEASLALHASSLAISKKAYIFLGKSGSGKSTVVRNEANNQKSIILSDNETFLRRTNGKTRCYLNPFLELSNIKSNHANEASFELGGVILLSKSSQEKLSDVSIAELLKSGSIDIYIPKSKTFKKDSKKTMHTLFKLTSQVKIMRLQFLKESKFSDIIRKYEISA